MNGRLSTEEHRLFDAACSGRLDATTRARLQDLLRESSEARVRYLDYTAVHADLFGAVRTARVRSQLLGVLDEEQSVGSVELNRGHRRWAGLALATLATAATIALALSIQPTDQRRVAVGPSSASVAADTDESLDVADLSRWPGLVARVNRVEGVEWEAGSERFDESGLIAAGGSIAIASGRIEIEFRQGVVVVLEGPACLIAEEANAASLVHGKLAAVAPPWATGFRVDTPGLDVVDHGTEFAVSVSRDQDDPQVNVVVTEGMVEVLADEQAGEGRRLRAGEGVNSTGNEVAAGDDAAARLLTEHLPERPEFKNGAVVGDRWADWTPGVAGAPCRDGAWRYYTNEADVFGEPAAYEELLWDAVENCYRPTSSDKKPWFSRFVRVHRDGGHPGKGRDQVWDKFDRYSITGFVVPEDGTYRLEAGWLERKWAKRWDKDAVLDIAVHVNDGPIVMREFCNRDSYVAFRKALGTLRAGDTIYVGVGPNGVDFSDKFRWGFCVVRETGPPAQESNAGEDDLAAAL